MSEEEDRDKDLCPMCCGTGKHNLLPPDGKIYFVILADSLRYDSTSFMSEVNESAKVGYEVHSMKEYGQHNQGAFILMKWRWP